MVVVVGHEMVKGPGCSWLTQSKHRVHSNAVLFWYCALLHACAGVSLSSIHKVALGEQELTAMGKRIRLQEKLDRDKETRRPTPAVRLRPSFGMRAKEVAPTAAPDASADPQRPSLDNVGDHEVKVRYGTRSCQSRGAALACRPCCCGLRSAVYGCS